MTIRALLLLNLDLEELAYGVPYAELKKLAYNGYFVNAAKSILPLKRPESSQNCHSPSI